MASSMWSAACLVFLLAASTKSMHSITDDHGYSDVYRVLKTIDRLLEYYNKDIENLNLDGFFGIRVLEGCMLAMLREHQSGQHQSVPDDIWQNISRLAKKATTISKGGQKFVREDNPKYFDDFSPLIKHPWIFFKKQRQLNPDLRWEIPQYKAKIKAPLSEKLSDKCIKEVLNASSTNCKLSELCLTTMTNRGLTGYGITHQLLWSMLTEMATICKAPVSVALKEHGMGSLDDMQLEMCTNNFYEMVAVVHVLMKGKIHESHQDLFLEQQFVCPSLGFHEFMKKDYLDQILSWQYDSGCFGDKEGEGYDEGDDGGDNIDIASLLETYHKEPIEKNQAIPKDGVQIMHQKSNYNSKNIIDRSGGDTAKHFMRNEITLKSEAKSQIVNNDFDSNTLEQRTMLQGRDDLPSNDNKNVEYKKRDNWIDGTHRVRRLLVEKRLTGGCLSHKSGVAAGAISIYLRYLIQPGDIKWNGPHELFEMDRQNMIPSNEEPRREDLTGAFMKDRGGDDNDEYYESVGKDEENTDTYYTYDDQENQPNVRKNKIVNGNDKNTLIRPALIQKEHLIGNEFMEAKDTHHNIRRSDDDNTFSNVLYNSVQEEKLKTNHPSAFLIILVSLSPMLMVFFFIFKVFRRHKLFRRCF